MGKDIKILLGIVGVTFLLIMGFAFWQSKTPSKDNPSSQEVLSLEVSPPFYDFGSVPIKGGIVEKIYEVKNTTEKTLKIKKIATSCMCTKAKVIIGETETQFFGMEGHAGRNPGVNLEVPSGQIARVVVNFDPAAHGPSGVGPFDRSIFLTFSDPVGIKELKFKGVVVYN